MEYPRSEVDFPDLVERIKRGEQPAMEQLYVLFGKGIRYFLCRQLGPQELDDKVHDTFIIVISAIRRGDLRQPDRLMGFIRTVVRRQVAASIDNVVHSRRKHINVELGGRVPDRRLNPEQTASAVEESELVERVLAKMPDRDRQVLTRSFLLDEQQEQTQAEMALTPTTYRLLKSRAKARFGRSGRQELLRKRVTSAYNSTQSLSA